MAAEKQHVARQHQVCRMCPRRCHCIDAMAHAHFSQRVHCLTSQEMTASSAPTSVIKVPTALLASIRSWRSPRLALTVGFGVVCARRVSVQTGKHVSWVHAAPRPRYVAQSLHVWSGLQAEQECGLCTAGRTTGFVGLWYRVVRSSVDIRCLAEHV